MGSKIFFSTNKNARMNRRCDIVTHYIYLSQKQCEPLPSCPPVLPSHGERPPTNCWILKGRENYTVEVLFRSDRVSQRSATSVFQPELAVTKVPVIDYYYNTSKSPKKKEREWLLAHLKELGDTEVTDTRISNWFNYRRRDDKRRSTLPSPTLAPDLTEKKWVDAHHETRKSSIQPSIMSSKSSIHTLTWVPRRHSLAISHEGNSGRSRESLC